MPDQAKGQVGGEMRTEKGTDSYDPSRFEHPSVTVDVVLLTIHEGRLWTLLVRRKEPPFQDRWALPGGFIGMQETLDAAAARVMEAKTGLKGIFLEQLYTFGEPGRDPRTRVLSVAHYSLVPHARLAAMPVDGMETALAEIQVPWEGEAGGPLRILGREGDALNLAFDHEHILSVAVKRLRGKINYSPVAFSLLPEQFTLFQLQKIHEAVLGRKQNKDSFRKRMLATGLLVPTGCMQQEVNHRPAALYRYTTETSRPKLKKKES